MTAEIYTYDKQLHKSWSLSEGRQRFNAEDLYDFNDLDSDTANLGMPSQDGPTQRNQAKMEEADDLKLQMEEMRRQMEREREEMRLQMEREREKMRLRMGQGENGEEIAQVQDELVPREGRKRKR